MPSMFVVGVGPGIGQSVARRFAAEGFDVGLVARSAATTQGVADALASTGAAVHGATADVADAPALVAALDELIAALGAPEVLVYNAGLIRADRLGELAPEDQLHAWSVNVVGAITAASHVAGRMADAGGGTILVTGGMPSPSAEMVSLSLGKAGVRALTEIMAAQYGPLGIHAATVTVGGAVTPGGAFDPDAIAEEYWRLHSQPAERWEREVLYAARTPAAG